MILLPDDPADLIAQGCADLVASWRDEFGVGYQSLNPDDPTAELYRESDDIRFLFVPTGESVRWGGGPVSQVEYAITMTAMAKLTATRSRRQMGRLDRMVRARLRGQKFAIGRHGYARFSSSETLTKFDPDASNQEATYFAVAELRFTTTEDERQVAQDVATLAGVED